MTAMMDGEGSLASPGDDVIVPAAKAASPSMGDPGVICPYVGVRDGGWRSRQVSREHRCLAVGPESLLAPEKQRRLCLTAGYVSCATLVAAVERRSGLAFSDPPGASRWGWARTAPLLQEQHRLGPVGALLAGERRPVQLGLATLMVLALLSVIIARTPSFGSPVVGVAPSGSPIVTPSPTASRIPGPIPSPTVPPVASEEPTLVPTPPPTAPPTPTAVPPTPTAASSPRTYTIRSGDSLDSIARRFGTTWQVLAALNNITDPTKIRPGQVLKLP